MLKAPQISTSILHRVCLTVITWFLHFECKYTSIFVHNSACMWISSATSYFFTKADKKAKISLGDKEDFQPLKPNNKTPIRPRNKPLISVDKMLSKRDLMYLTKDDSPLQDVNMAAAGALLKKQFPKTAGFQPTVYNSERLQPQPKVKEPSTNTGQLPHSAEAQSVILTACMLATSLRRYNNSCEHSTGTWQTLL